MKNTALQQTSSRKAFITVLIVSQVLNLIRRNSYTGKRICKVADLDVLIKEAYAKI